MAGGLLAAHREYFFEIGGYAKNKYIYVWGGENLEISFRVWMCGGSLEFVPCSRVGHIFRPGHPYNMTGEKGKGDVHGRNSMRLAEVWMDDYKRFYYMHRHDLKGKDYGDVESRREIRKRLNCYSFKWYLDNVFPEKFILDENVHAYGEVRNPSSSLCLDTLGRDEKGSISLSIFSCQNGVSANQNQKWIHEKNGLIVHHPSKLCLDVEGLSNNDQVKLKKCEPNKPSQRWVFEHYSTT
ncbi:unnamed protein product [Rotaria sordida]|uniref:Ricin B lectin domain-containing protein n=1 Tax=Rotaria sordida TaxID=392033 RepID=A0A815GD86_9BILA|nr:unnamed protein product [Rotaria sordida]CAF1338140.1 unnamed protein product [Rotaria sordida]CAF1556841.1 unnamed protein product [Rotaria sordida]